MLVVGSDNQRFVLDVLDYEDKGSEYRQERNQLLISIELKSERGFSVITGALLATHELSALGNWFGQLASGALMPPITLLEPGLSMQATIAGTDTFLIKILMNATASPQWSHRSLASEPFEMDFALNYQQMIQAAQQLQELHQRFPTQ